MGQIGPTLITIVVSIIGLAMVAVVVSKNAQTTQVISAGGSALSKIIGAAVQPVSGNAFGSAFGSIGSSSNLLSGGL
jgi:hypothetical protein